MARLLLSLWNKISRKQSDLQIKIDNLLNLLHSKDEETQMLGLSLCLEELPNDILNIVVPYKDYGYPYYSFGTDLYKRPHSLSEIIKLGLNHKEIEPVRKYSYNFLMGTVFTVQYVLYNIKCYN